MFFDGCRWDYEQMSLADQEPGVIHVKAPVVHFVPSKTYRAGEGTYSCPLYKTSVRAGTLSTTGHSTNFVLSIDVDSNFHPSYWVLKGAALLTMLNE